MSDFALKRNTNLEIITLQTKYFDHFFTFTYLFGLYSGISFFITDDLFIPYILCGISSIYFLFRNVNDLKASQLLPILYLAIIPFVGILFAFEMSEFFIERIKGLVQLIYSIIVSYLFFLNLKKWNPKNVCNLFTGLIVLILIGTFFEIFTNFKEVSDEFRYNLFRDNIYAADLRDIYFYGIIRPKLFTTEPSHVAKFYVLCMFVWFSLSVNRLRYLLLFVFLFSGLFLIRSPLLLIVLPISLIIEIFFRKKIILYSILKEKGIIIEKWFAVIIVIFSIVWIFSFNTILDKRINEIISGYDDSFGVRFLGPGLIAIEVLKKYPVWGSGITGKEAISEIIEGVYYKINVKYYNIHSFSTNIVMSFFIYFGFLGGLLFGFGMYLLIKRLKIKQRFFLLTTFLIFGQTMGAFVGLRPWGYFFIIASVAHFYPFYSNKHNIKILGTKMNFPRTNLGV